MASYNQIIHSEDYNGNLYNPPYGYSKGYYLSGDATTGEEQLKERANIYLTGFMPYRYGQKIQLRDVGFIYNSPSATYNRIAFYDENKTGQLMSRLTNDLFSLTELYHHGPEDIVISSIKLVGSFIILWICFAFLFPDFASFSIFASFKDINAISDAAKNAFKAIKTINSTYV